MLRTTLLTLFFLITTLRLSAQEQADWQELLHDLTTTDDIDSDEWQDYIETLETIHNSPFDINKATKEDLEQLFFLSDSQIEDIISYVYQYGPVRSLGELSMIESINFDTRRLLLNFLTIAQPKAGNGKLNLKDVAKYGKHDLTLSAQIPFYERRGDANGYLGYQYKHSFRYLFSYGNKLKIGLIGSQDAGEPFFAGKNKTGYDYYSFYASIANVGRVKKLIVGRYKASFGMGLVINSNLSFGKLMTLNSLGRKQNALTEHSSRSEANYLQGAAVSINATKTLNVSVFASYRYIDATLSPDDNATIRTILTSGYHRTESEMQRHNNAKEQLAGMNITFRNNGWQLGATAIANHFSLPLKPDTRQQYRQWQPEGQNFWNIGFDYGYRHYRFSLQGETATGTGGAIATVNRLTVQPSSRLALVALQRFYSYKFVGTHSRSFSEGGRVQNESGIYLGAEWRPIRPLAVSAYGDMAHFAWPRYQVFKESNVYDFMLQTTYEQRKWTLLARYSMKNSQKNNADKTDLTDDCTQRLRFAATFRGRTLSLRTQLDGAANKYKEEGKGWMIGEHVAWQAMKQVRLSVSAAYFHTDNYASRLYAYEPGLLYQMSFPAFYGKGFHVATHVRADVNSHLMMIARLSVTDYFDRNHISSGLQQIDRSSKTDLELQLRWRF